MFGLRGRPWLSRSACGFLAAEQRLSSAGGATPDGSGEALVISTRRLNRIRSLDAAAGIAVCEAGVILAHLHEAALAVGRCCAR